MKRITIIAAAGAVLLAGCSGGGNADADGNGEVTAKEVAKKAEAEGPLLDAMSPEEMLGHIEAIREIMEFSDVEKEIRTMCEQSALPKALVDIAVSDPAKLDALEKEAGG